MAYEFSIFWFLSGFLMLLPHFVCSFLIERRSHFLFRTILGILLFSVAAYFTCFTDQWNDKYYLLLHLGGFLYLIWCCRCSLRHLVYFNIWCIVLYYLAFQIRALISAFAGSNINDELTQYLYLLLSASIIFLLTFFIVKALLQKDVYSLKTNHVIISALISVSVIAINTIIYSTMVNDGFMIFMFQVFSMLCTVLALYMLVVSVYSQKKTTEAEYIEHMLKSSKKDYELKAEYIDLINHKYHDLKHQIRALKAMENNERKEYITEIEESVDRFANLFQTGNEYMDAILNEGRRRCDREKIMFSCVANCGSISFIDVVDMYILLGNILDNAIEAALNLPEENRVVDVKIHTDEHFLRITEKNTYSGDITFTHDGMVSSKPDDGFHGFGSQSMKYIVEKYKGQLAYDAENSIFSLHILIPIPKSAE